MAACPTARTCAPDAQAWLRDAGYQPTPVDAGSHALMFAAGFVPWLRLDDRPEDQRHSLVFQVSLPASLEAFVLQRWPQSQRLAFCLGADRIVMRRGGSPLPDDCRPGPGDRVWAL